jgi:hypothetical protein
MMEDEEYITPEWLESKGFVRTTPGAQDNKGAWDLKYPFNDGDLCFIETDFDRRQFAVIMSVREEDDDPKSYLHSVLVRVDAGCGFVDIPSGYVEWPIYSFSLLYKAIRGKKL